MAAVQSVCLRVKDVFKRAIMFNTDHRVALIINKEPLRRNLHEASKWQRLTRRLWQHINSRLTIVSALCSRQCCAIAAQRVRRTVQIAALYGNLGYDLRAIQMVAQRLGGAFIQKLSKSHMVFGLALFAWQKDSVTEDEIARVADEIVHISHDTEGRTTSDDTKLETWEHVIKKNNLIVWRKPIPNSYLYEYKVYGTYSDIPARAFYRAQVDLEFRKQWDKLVINLDVVDEDTNSGVQVIHWVTHFPYPMYSRDYVYVRKCVVDNDRRLMVIVNRSVDHPSVPVTDKYVRVHTYMSEMVIRPHTSFDESGFDYILTYYDDPKAAFPSFAYNWMATTGVPDYVNKVHSAAKLLHERKKTTSVSEEESSPSSRHRIPM